MYYEKTVVIGATSHFNDMLIYKFYQTADHFIILDVSYKFGHNLISMEYKNPLDGPREGAKAIVHQYGGISKSDCDVVVPNGWYNLNRIHTKVVRAMENWQEDYLKKEWAGDLVKSIDDVLECFYGC